MICFWWQRLVDGVRVSLLGGVGRGGAGALTFKYTGTPTWCYARDVFTYTCTSTWCNAGDVFTCTCTATWCYARDVFACTCTSTWCYAATLSWHNTQRILCQVKHTQSQFTSKIRKIMRWNTKEPFFSWYDNAEAWWHIYIYIILYTPGFGDECQKDLCGSVLGHFVPTSSLETWPTRSLNKNKCLKCCEGCPKSTSSVTLPWL